MNGHIVSTISVDSGLRDVLAAQNSSISTAGRLDYLKDREPAPGEGEGLSMDDWVPGQLWKQMCGETEMGIS